MIAELAPPPAGDTGRSLLLNGHIDVVPVGDLKTWTKDPFGGEYCAESDKVYGRGTSDMKGGVFAMILAVESIKNCGIELLGKVIVNTVVEEESGGAGSLSAIRKGVKADACLIPEPSGKKIFPVQQGSVWFKVEVPGRAAHGGTRYEGVSAIENSFKVYQQLLNLEKSRNRLLVEGHPLYKGISIPVPINVGTIEGGKWPSSVPDMVVMQGRMGVIPGETYQQAQNVLLECIKQLNENDAFLSEGHPVTCSFYGARWLPGQTPLDHPVLDILKDCHAQTMGSPAVVEASPWGTDGGLFSTLANVPSIVYGPGVTSMAHYADEYVLFNDVLATAEVIALVLLRYLSYRTL